MNAVVTTEPSPLLKLDLGCGPNKRAGFIGVDSRKFPGVDVVTDLNARWPWKDASVEEIHSSHVLEHFSAVQRIHIFNEMYRVLIPNGRATIVTPHWASGRAYGDPSHQWPPVCEMSYYYLNKEWRAKNAPHTDIEHSDGGYTCDFDHSGGYSWHPEVAVRNLDYQMYAAKFLKEAAQDLMVTVTRRP
jgi:SAM-dependent methyltransferase